MWCVIHTVKVSTTQSNTDIQVCWCLSCLHASNYWRWCSWHRGARARASGSVGWMRTGETVLWTGSERTSHVHEETHNTHNNIYNLTHTIHLHAHTADTETHTQTHTEHHQGFAQPIQLYCLRHHHRHHHTRRTPHTWNFQFLPRIVLWLPTSGGLPVLVDVYSKPRGFRNQECQRLMWRVCVYPLPERLICPAIN